MSDLILAAESGVETSQPREIYEINQSGFVTYRIASGTRDIVDGGQTYTAQPAARTDLTLSTTTADVQLTLSLPLSHGLVQRWMASMSPPKIVTVTIRRVQLGVGTEQFFFGVVSSMAIEKHLAKFSLQSEAQRQWSRTLGKVVSRTCGHFLYDRGCKVTKGLFGITTTIATIDGRRITVASVAPLSGPAQTTYFPFGEFVHLASGERQTMFSQFGERVDLQSPIPGMQVGDAVQLFAGCAHDMLTCHNKFGNEANFFGAYQLPTHEFFIPGYRLGVLTQP